MTADLFTFCNAPQVEEDPDRELSIDERFEMFDAGNPQVYARTPAAVVGEGD